MNAFIEGGKLSASATDQATVVLEGAAPSRPVAQYWPRQGLHARSGNGFHSLERAAFKRALYATLEKKVEGALSPYLFYDPPEYTNSGQVNYQSAWGSKDNVPYGAPGWDAHIASSTRADNKDPYSFAQGDKQVIQTALQEGLVERLPRRITYYSYGPGELIAVRAKDFQLLDAIQRSPAHNLEALNAVDINERYAGDFASEANARYNKATFSVQGDFMEGTLGFREKVGTSVIAAFGGPFANAPSTATITAKQRAAQYLAQLVSQHGEGTRVIITIDTSDKEAALADYEPTRHFEAFMLGAFPRAVHENIIRKPYDVFNNWKLITEFSDAERAIKLKAQAKRAHTIHTEDKKFGIKKGDQYVLTLSHKWKEEDWKDICKAAGLDEPEFFGKGTRKLFVARAVREPDLSLI